MGVSINETCSADKGREGHIDAILRNSGGEMRDSVSRSAKGMFACGDHRYRPLRLAAGNALRLLLWNPGGKLRFPLGGGFFDW